jgi:hypothetical protein
MKLFYFSLLFLLFLVPSVHAQLAVWHEPATPVVGEAVNIYANASFDCFNKIWSKYRINNGNWQDIWNGGWTECQSSFTRFLITHEFSNVKGPIGPFANSTTIEYSVSVGKDSDVMETKTKSFVIGATTTSSMTDFKTNSSWMNYLAIVFILLAIGVIAKFYFKRR